VALSGGVFQNDLLLEKTLLRLASAGFTVHRPIAAPPNDGGVALGQAAIALARMESDPEESPSQIGVNQRVSCCPC
jgi:hydrogenase maturation protein HypF